MAASSVSLRELGMGNQAHNNARFPLFEWALTAKRGRDISSRQIAGWASWLSRVSHKHSIASSNLAPATNFL